MNAKTGKVVLLGLLVVTVIALPYVLDSNYWLNLVNLAISFSIACLGLNIVLGYTGQINLGQASFWGIGAYTSAILTTRLDMNVWPAMVLAFIVAGLAGHTFMSNLVVSMAEV